MKNKLSISLIVSHFLASRERRGLWGHRGGGTGFLQAQDFLGLGGGLGQVWGPQCPVLYSRILTGLSEHPNKISATHEC